MPHYGKVGTTEYMDSDVPVDGFIEMNAPKVTDKDIAQPGGYWLTPTETYLAELSIEQADMLCNASSTEELKLFLLGMFT